MVLLRNIALVALTLGSGVAASNAAYFKRAPEDMSTTSVAKTTTGTETTKSTATSGTESSMTSGSATSTKVPAPPTPTPTPTDDTDTGGSGSEEDPEHSGDPPKEAQACSSEKDLSVKPFCSPHDQQEVYVDDTYYVTWLTSLISSDIKVKIGLDYVNVTANEGLNAWISHDVPNRYSYVTVQMRPEWLKGEKRNNLTLFMDELPAGKDKIRHTGPTISLINRPPVHHPPPPPTPAPKPLGLLIGLPLGLGAVFLILLGLCIGMKNQRRIGLSNIMGRRNKGYGGRNARAMRSGRGAGGSIRLDDMEDNGQQYSDTPERLPSRQQIVSDTDTFNEVQRREGNAFRQELARLKNWK
ncbi:hypothetical protein MGYG_06930 [Nannizzia gypsea CBS 118893]|uniref:Uncharacterized protein n=1 Tax=Arthroderma gypseum (strain ATCC MYA-4604 / CBS 118893) TaxID=535722 RepID=E4V1L6_ARTGP|nr:hypothetical protein MGYG_06930 [Nannizzia gypsea CBS 118893]EFR03931.1 hypothetical protein MGYG_06930 [Nannizzia gypsea CBS 118893]